VEDDRHVEQVARVEGQALDRLDPEDRRQAVDDVIRLGQSASLKTQFGGHQTW
jgi:hypothetical protein